MKICIVGLGYVGLPLAVEFAGHYTVIGYDRKEARISELKAGHDSTGEVKDEALKQPNLSLTADASRLKEADFIIVAVPTPVHEDSKLPDLHPVESASETVGKNIKMGAIVCYESTVYPGVTEDICVPIIEKNSGLQCGKDWKIAYSPERVVPGDKVRTIRTITKIVSGMDEETLDKVAEAYGKICPVYKAASIKVAEAAKVIENVQRDVNIALVNELSLIFHRLGIDTKEVLDAAATKWNFHRYHPGLVGGHCIGVDPYYLAYIAQKKGYYPKVMLSGREVNEEIALHVARQVMQGLNSRNKVLQQCTVLVMGLTFKENVPDIRNSKVKDMIRELKALGISVIGLEPWLSKEAVKEEFGIDIVNFDEINGNVDAIILAQAHDAFRKITLDMLKAKMKEPFIFDIKRMYSKEEARAKGFIYMGL